MEKLRLLTLGVLVAGSAPLAVTQEVSASPKGRPVAVCDTAPGRTVGLSDGWRIFWPSRHQGGARWESPPLYACRRAPGALTRVRILARSEAYDASRVVSFVGDVVELDVQGRGSESGRFIDLRRGVSTPGRVSFTGSSGDYPDYGTEASLLPDGAVATAKFTLGTSSSCGCLPYELGELGIDDGDGVRAVGPPAQELVASHGLDGVGSGVYALAADGVTALKAQSTGPARDLVWSKSTDLAWHRVSYRVRKSATTSTPLAGDGAEISLRSRRSSRGPASLHLWATGASADGIGLDSAVLEQLAPRSQPEVHVLDVDDRRALVVARFADRPAESRLRLFVFGSAANSSAATAQTVVDLPATQVSTVVGGAVLTPKGFALVAPDAVRIWGPSPVGADALLEQAVPAPGAGDLAVSRRGTLFYTDAAGPHAITGRSTTGPVGAPGVTPG